ncbi:MAG: hypothetical protein JKX70_02280 [Phycisphaerales bacterium]|nr:hypothetical protein [Phycisphaerales bacterium]
MNIVQIKPLCLLTCLLCSGLYSSLAMGGEISGEHKRKAELAIHRNIEYLGSRQNTITFGWDDDPEAQAIPAITGLVLQGLLLDPGIDERHPLVIQGARYILKFVQDDGSIHDGMLPSYNTAICVSALSKLHTQRALSGMLGGQKFLRTLQYSDINTNNPNDPGFDEPIDINHPYYGGVGYGKHGRPDLSNLSFFLQALHDTGVSTQDPAYQRALVFLSRVQMSDEVNEMPYADGSSQGGFIYATVPDLESVDGIAGQSQAGDIIETAEDGQELSRLRAYGSMSYAGFKSLVYANIDPDDPRMADAWKWIQNNYTLEENPGLGMQGYYFYLATMARALDAHGVDEINGHNWREEMIDKLHSLQFVNGAYRTLNPRWMEDNDILIAAYALIALEHAAH